MGMKYYKTDKFLKLKQKWYGKLKDDGFEDIEEGNEYGLLKESSVKTRKRYKLQTAEYYRACRIFCSSHKFPTDLDRFIFELHSEGYSARKIVEILKTKPSLRDLNGIRAYRRTHSLSHVTILNKLRPIKLLILDNFNMFT